MSDLKRISYLTPIVPCLILVIAIPAHATISRGQVDDFQAGDNEWGPSQTTSGSPVSSVVSDAGPNGTGDDALFVENGLVRHGSADISVEPSATDQWNGNWSSELITHIRMDVRNPTDSPLTLRLGMAGSAGPGAFFGGDTYLSANPIIVPADNTYHSVLFDVTPSAWSDFGGSDSAAALLDVTHLRVIANPNPTFRGANGADMYLDNITAIPEPASASLVAGCLVALGFRRNRAV